MDCILLRRLSSRFLISPNDLIFVTFFIFPFFRYRFNLIAKKKKKKVACSRLFHTGLVRMVDVLFVIDAAYAGLVSSVRRNVKRRRSERERSTKSSLWFHKRRSQLLQRRQSDTLHRPIRKPSRKTHARSKQFCCFNFCFFYCSIFFFCSIFFCSI